MQHEERVHLISETIEKAMNKGYKKFYIYPFGTNGLLTKCILNERYGIQESGIFDNKLAKYNVHVKRINEIGGGTDVALLVNSEGGLTCKLLKDIPSCFDKKQIFRIFNNEEWVNLDGYGWRNAPWSGDDEFCYWYDRARTYTLVDKIRMFNLWQMVKETAKLGAGDVIEVGVWRGGSGCMIAKSVELYGTNQEHVYLCDTFSGVVKAGKKDNYYVGGEHADTSRGIVENLAKEMGLENVSILQGVFPEDTGKDIKGKSFRFAHVDVDVYQSAKDIVELLWQQMLPGAIMAFDDYGFSTCYGIRRYLDEIKGEAHRMFIPSVGGQAFLLKIR